MAEIGKAMDEFATKSAKAKTPVEQLKDELIKLSQAAKVDKDSWASDIVSQYDASEGACQAYLRCSQDGRIVVDDE